MSSFVVSSSDLYRARNTKGLAMPQSGSRDLHDTKTVKELRAKWEAEGSDNSRTSQYEWPRSFKRYYRKARITQYTTVSVPYAYT